MPYKKLFFYSLFLIAPLIVVALFSLDRAISDYFYAHRGDALWHFGNFITYFGKSDLYFIIAIALFLMYRKSNATLARFGIYLLLLNLLSGIMVNIFKFIFAKTRPLLYHSEGLFSFEWFKYEHAYNAFPSGHSATALAIWFGLALLLPRYKVALTLIGVMVALSRMVIDAHYLSDVIFGSWIGVVTALLLYHKMQLKPFETIELKPYLILGFSALFALFSLLAYLPLFDLDEGAFSEATREMMVGRDYITTYLNGELRFDKPILFYWFQLLGIQSFGVYEFGARIASAWFALLWIGVTFVFVKRLVDNKSAFWAAFLMLTTLQISIISKAAIADALLNFTVAVSMFSIYLYYLKREQKYIYLTFAFMALGVLTKGPVAILIPLAVSAIFFIWLGAWRVYLKALFHIPAILLFVLIAAPWYFLEYQAQGQAFIDGFFLKHNIERFGSSMEQHSGSLFYYVGVIVVGMLPFTALLYGAFKTIKAKLQEPLMLFLLIWFAFVFIFFSFSSTKLPHYVIYGYTPLIILMAMGVEKIKNEFLLMVPLLIFLLLMIAFPDLLVLMRDTIKDAYVLIVVENIHKEFDLDYKLLLSALAIILIAFTFSKVAQEYKVMAMGIIFIIALNFGVLKSYANLVQQPIKEAAFLAKSNNWQVVMWKMNTPSFSFYAQRIVKRREPNAGEIVLTKLPKLKAIKRYEVLYQKYGVVLARVIAR
ncbi:MAG: phosphatase PAP2 family protein [Campylobacterales bacterium]|nr:phosphatase PAP2 family protein [Campylobacterales bacterium]